jgi:NAD(P)H-hydrate epimerase
MKRVGSDAIRKLDQSAIRDYAIPALLLMENAGRSVSDVISCEYKPCKVLVFIGKGNNGGDGLVVARHLANRGFLVQVAFLEDPTRFKADSLLNFSIVSKMNIPRSLMAAFSEGEILELCQETDLVVDAIFGIGIHGPMRGIFEKAIRAINGSQRPVVSIDIPSGLDADNGQVHGVAVKATRTVTLALPKRGLFEGEGPRYAGEIEVADIGIPRELLLPFLS